MLTVEGLRSRYGRIEVLHGLDLEVSSGEIVTVVGANGAGKTTLLKCLSGTQPVSDGTIVFRGESFNSVPAHKRLKRGLAQSPEGRQIFTNLTVEENLRLGAFLFTDERVDRDMADAFAMFPILKEKRNLAAGGLSGGQQQMLAIGRGLMARPKLMMLDEPSLGLSPLLTQEIFDIIARLNAEQGVTMLLVEQNAHIALATAHTGYVLEMGRIVMAGSTEKLRASDDIQEFYLGKTGETQRDQKRWKRRKTWR